jgi:hypothetical protein
MTPKQAEEKGLSKTGIYNFDKEKNEEILKELKIDKRYKVYSVFIKSSEYSRGYLSGGYTIYASKEYFEIERMKQLENILPSYKLQKERLQKEYTTELQKINILESSQSAELQVLQEKYEN